MILVPHTLAFVFVLVFTLIYLILGIKENSPANSVFWAWLGVLVTALAFLW